MKSKELKKLSIIELRRLAISLHVSLTRKMSKEQIIKAIVASTRSRAISATLKKKKRYVADMSRHMAAEKHRVPPVTQGENLPVYTGIAKLVLLPRDPWWIFAYWEIDAAQIDNKGLVLRVYRKTGQLYASIQVGHASNWYIDLPEPEETVKSEIGYMESKSRFKVIAVSNTIKTPRAWPSRLTYETGSPGTDRTSAGHAATEENDPFSESYKAFEKLSSISRKEITSRKR